MVRYPKRFWILAAGLAALAGYVDAIGFLKLGGFFVSFMSGNSTRLAIGIVTSPAAAELAGGLVAAFVAGTIAGALVGRAVRYYRKAAVLLFVAALLYLAAITDTLSIGRVSAFILAAAMGAENGVFQRDGEVSVALTYMTGTLVKLGHRLAAALTGGDAWSWLPHLLLWCSLTTGAVVGAEAYLHFGSAAVWASAIAATALAGYALVLESADRAPVRTPEDPESWA